MKRIRYETFQDGYEFNIPKQNIIATEMYDVDFSSGEDIPHIAVWYVVEENITKK